MNKEFIIVFTYLKSFFLFLPNYFIDKVIIVHINQIIKGPALEFGESLHFVSI